MDDKLAGLARHTIIVADTGDIAQIKAVRAEDCTTNPSLILKAASKPEYAALMQDAGGSWFIKYDSSHYRDVFPEPGVKDVDKIAAFCKAVAQC